MSTSTVESNLPAAPHPLASRQVVFLHIPKTGGVTVRSLLTSCFEPTEVFQVGHPDDLLKLSDEQINQCGLITGHFPYSCVMPRLREQPMLLTFLRDPVDRVLSFFYYIKEQRHNFTRWVPRPNLVKALNEVSEMSISEFARSEERKVLLMRNDRMTRLIGADDERAEPQSEAQSEAWLQAALERLESFAFVGLTERLFESSCLLSEQLLVPVPDEVEQRNRTRRRRKADDLDEETLELLRAANSYDQRLYDHAAQLFEQRWQRWTRECAQARYRSQLRARVDELPRSVQLDLGGPVRGLGWYEPERTPAGLAFRWSGPGVKSSVDLLVRTDTNLQLDCDVGAWFHQDAVRGIRVFCNGVPVAVLTSPGKPGWLHLAGELPVEALTKADDVLRLSFEVPSVLSPSEKRTKASDDRELGFALASLRVAPTDGR